MEHKGTIVIQTERLLLRPFRAGDAEPMFQNWASDPEVTKFLTWPAHESIDITNQVLAGWRAENENAENYQWAIELKELGEPIGSISAVKVDSRTESATIGYCIGRRFWGKGITAEALQAVIRFFFEEAGANCVNACHDPRNPNSGKVMKKCGMSYEGTRRANGIDNQGICDEVWYSILKEEYIRNTRQKSIIEEIQEESVKKRIAREILESLEEWFGIPEAREEYIKNSAGQIFFSAALKGQPVGFLCLKETGKDTAELTVMGVLERYHRRGIGRELFYAAKKRAVELGYSFLQVKTVQMGRYNSYDKTNCFYQSLGFKEFEVFPGLWDKANPCQIYVMETGLTKKN